MKDKSQNICSGTESGIDFNGHINITESGKVCQRWDVDVPYKHTHHRLDTEDNYCRNIGDKDRPWCYTTDPATKWEYCDIPQCEIMETKRMCIPLEKSCDGVPDCPNEEDEVNCGEFSCPAMFKCRGTPKCIPLYWACDNVEDCPNGDDEILCNFNCPPECECRGLSFKCISLNKDVAFNISKYARNIDLNGVKLDIENIIQDLFLILPI
ncbi:hypothetical protein KUTeg_012991 [Tegillarca granosa]|uniref:Kringle domain-containing protein n=1 Tax=Tegillarca granosa TaxID=220873 RepID=A0ABQ9EVW1_TEGGR|nr:hypothetical protein KUTeg_012991 [Tegillarca granosa]